jgi:hypothetical protein
MTAPLTDQPLPAAFGRIPRPPDRRLKSGLRRNHLRRMDFHTDLAETKKLHVLHWVVK